MSLYEQLMESVIYEDSIEEYKERISLQESGSIIGEGLKFVLKVLGAVLIGPYIVALPIVIIFCIAMKVSGKKKDKIFKLLNKSPEFKSYIQKLIKEIQTNVSKEISNSKYLINNSIGELNSKTADINFNNNTLCIKSIISYDIEKVWIDKLGISSLDYDTQHNDNPDYNAPAPKIIKEITQDIEKDLEKIGNKNFRIDFEENIDNYFYYLQNYDRSYNNNKGLPINLYINFNASKEIKNATEKYLKNKYDEA